MSLGKVHITNYQRFRSNNAFGASSTIRLISRNLSKRGEISGNHEIENTEKIISRLFRGDEKYLLATCSVGLRQHSV
jgi:hypothetical protein